MTASRGSEVGDGGGRLTAPSRESFIEAMLRACGELGYEQVDLDELLRRSGGERDDFLRHFADPADCYVAAYEVEAARLCGEILKRGAAAPDWRAGLRAALDFAAEFIAGQPQRARALLLDVHMAGDAAEDRRRQASERLARAVDSARAQADAGRAPPPLTAVFMVSAVEAAAISALVRGEPASFREAAPELEQLIVSAYFGD